MSAITLDLGHILIDRVLTMIAAIVRFRLCSTRAHIVLTLLACHVYLPALSSRGLYLDIDVLLLRTRKTAAIEEYSGNDRYDYDQRQRPYDAAACSFAFCHFLFLPVFSNSSAMRPLIGDSQEACRCEITREIESG